MGGIRRKNTREVDLNALNVSASIPPHAPEFNTLDIVGAVAPADGVLKHVTLSIALPGTNGDSSDALQIIAVQNAGFPGDEATAISAIVTLRSEVTGAIVLRAEGDIVQIPGNGVKVLRGQIMKLVHTVSGTEGTGDNCTFNIVGFVFEAESHVDSIG